MARHFKIVVEKYSDEYVAYPLGLKGTVVGEGYEEALADVKSAIRFHIETFGPEVISGRFPADRGIHSRGDHRGLMSKFPVDAPRPE